MNNLHIIALGGEKFTIGYSVNGQQFRDPRYSPHLTQFEAKYLMKNANRENEREMKDE